MYESGHEGPQYDPLPDADDLALRPQEASPDVPEPLASETEPELLGPARRSDRSWGTLSAAAVLIVALLGAFLWFHRADAPRVDPPPFAPPAVAQQPAAPPPAIVEPHPPAPAPEIVEEPAEELPAEPEPEEPSIEMAPGPARTPPPVQTVEVIEPPRPEPAPKARPKIDKPERPHSQEPTRVAAAKSEAPPVVVPPAPKRAYGPPAERMAGVLRPGPGVEMPVPLDLPRVRYPEAARGKGLKVDVHLDLLVDEQGKVVEAVVREDDPENLGFNEAAVQAALGTRFQPATRWDVPGRAWTELILEFEEPGLGR